MYLEALFITKSEIIGLQNLSSDKKKNSVKSRLKFLNGQFHWRNMFETKKIMFYKIRFLCIHQEK